MASDWRDRGLCAETDPEAFFPEKGGSTQVAKKICRGCDVRAECLEYALETDQRFGVWGGLSERQRRHLSHDRKRVRTFADVQPCGTHAAYKRHQRRGEPICDECRRAESARVLERRAAQRLQDGEAA